MTTIEHPWGRRRAPATRWRTSVRLGLWRRRQALPHVAQAVRARGTIAIRRAGPDDEAALDRLAELTERGRPAWPLIVAEVDGEIVAAVTIDGQAEMRNPFEVTGDVAALLQLRAAQLRDTTP